MHVRARHLPSFLGGLAVGLAAGVVVAALIEWRVQAEDLTWSLWLWISGCVVALVALLVGLIVDRRGFSVPLALFALLMLGGLVGVFFFLAWRGSA